MKNIFLLLGFLFFSVASFSQPRHPPRPPHPKHHHGPHHLKHKHHPHPRMHHPMPRR